MKSSNINYICWFVFAGISLWMTRCIYFAWINDPSMKYGVLIFILWLIVVIPLWRFSCLCDSSAFYGYIAVFCLLFLGILGSLNFPIYIAFSLILCLPLKSVKWKITLFFYSLLWMPFWAWLTVSLFGKPIVGINLAIALIITGSSLYYRIRLYEP